MEKFLVIHIFSVLCILLSIPRPSSSGIIEIKPHIHIRRLNDDQTKDFVFNISLWIDTQEQHGSVALKSTSLNTEIASVTNELFIIPENTLSNISLRISGHFLGETDLKILVNQSLNGTIKGDDPSWVEYIDAYNVIVTRESRPIDTAFIVSIIILVCIANIAMGCKTDIGVVKATLKKPIAPLTGLASQFLLMPLVNIDTLIDWCLVLTSDQLTLTTTILEYQYCPQYWYKKFIPVL